MEEKPSLRVSKTDQVGRQLPSPFLWMAQIAGLTHVEMLCRNRMSKTRLMSQSDEQWIIAQLGSITWSHAI